MKTNKQIYNINFVYDDEEKTHTGYIYVLDKTIEIKFQENLDYVIKEDLQIRSKYYNRQYNHKTLEGAIYYALLNIRNELLDKLDIVNGKIQFIQDSWLKEKRK